MTDKKKMGAPTKYKEEYCETVLEFFDKPLYEYIYIDEEDDEGNVKKTVATNKSGEPIRVPAPLPTKERFAFSIGVHTNTLLNWANENPDFLCAIKKAENLQKDILIQNGLIQAYDKTFAIFVAKNVTDMSDKKELEITEGESLTPWDEIDAE